MDIHSVCGQAAACLRSPVVYVQASAELHPPVIPLALWSAAVAGHQCCGWPAGVCCNMLAGKLGGADGGGGTVRVTGAAVAVREFLDQSVKVSLL